jgi:hypothetical protein
MTAAPVNRVMSLPARRAGPQFCGDLRGPGVDGRPVAEVAGWQGGPRGRHVLHEPLAETGGRCVRVVGAEEDFLTPRAEQLRELVELLRPSGFKGQTVPC